MIKEYIIFAAIKRTDKCIIYGKHHAECIAKSPFGTCKNGSVQGFLTSELRFVGREEASKIAYMRGQISSWKKGQILMSEEIWSKEMSNGSYEYDIEKGYVKKVDI